MKHFFTPNIGNRGRIVRGLMGVLLLVGAAFAYGHSAWLAIALTVAGVFGLFEAYRGWCAARACGIKTKF